MKCQGSKELGPAQLPFLVCRGFPGTLAPWAIFTSLLRKRAKCVFFFKHGREMNRRQTYEQANKVFDKAMKLEQEFGEYFTGECPEWACTQFIFFFWLAAVTSLPALSYCRVMGNVQLHQSKAEMAFCHQGSAKGQLHDQWIRVNQL